MLPINLLEINLLNVEASQVKSILIQVQKLMDSTNVPFAKSERQKTKKGKQLIN